MEKRPRPADLQRWSREVARDPASLAFLPLADVYRRQGQRDAALRLCLRGLERHPDHPGAHALLARIYLEMGEREKAFDEWGIVLRLDPSSFEANRGVGFFHLERGDSGKAREYLERASSRRPDDSLTSEALAMAMQREAAAREQTAARRETARRNAARRDAARRSAAAAGPRDGVAQPMDAPERRSDASTRRDPARIFESLESETPFKGALLLDGHGLLLAGRLGSDGDGRSEALGAIVAGAVEEAARTANLLELGGWRGLLLHAEDAVLHIAPLRTDNVLILAAETSAPSGWVVRSAEAAAALANGFLGAEDG